MLRMRFHYPDLEYVLDLIDAYARAVRYKVLPIFDDLKAQAEAADGKFREWIGRFEYGPEDGPEFDYQMDEWDAHFTRLSLDFEVVPRQMIGLVIAGLYHLWERLTKEYLLRELSNQPQAPTSLRKWMQGTNFQGLVDVFEQFGWQMRSEAFFSALDRTRLISNVLKHGGGKSATDLIATAPELFNYDPPKDLLNDPGPTADDLLLSPQHFDVAVRAVNAFFNALPHELMLNETLQLT